MPFVSDFAEGIKVAIQRMGQPCVVAGKSVYAMLEDNYEPVNFGDRVFESNMPMLTAATSDVSHASRGDTVAFNGTNYSIAEIRPQDGGVTEIKLTETI